jgi:hypothetical protein
MCHMPLDRLIWFQSPSHDSLWALWSVQTLFEEEPIVVERQVRRV